MSVIYNLFTNPWQKAKTKPDKTSYVLIMSKRDGKILGDKTRTKPRHNLDIDIDNDIDIYYVNIIFLGVMSLRSIILGRYA